MEKEKNRREGGKEETWVQRPDMTSVGKVTMGHLHQVVEEGGGRRERRGESKQIGRLGDAQCAWRVRACLHVRVRVRRSARLH
jgi:hypothetical protein